MTAVAFKNVTKRYGEVTAVDRVSFEIADGHLVTLLGPSGCGKTTTLRMIAGLEMATEGTIEIDGKDVTHLSATERDVTMVFQSYALFPHMTVLQNVAYGLNIAKRADAEAKAEAGLETVGLGGFGARLPSELSGGQQQRVAVARALVLEPKVLLFDEPLSNLDAKLRRKMRDDIRALQQRIGFAAVYVTHDQEEALSVSDEIILMDRSVIVQKGPPRELYLQPVTEFVARFLGDSNVVPARVEQGKLMVTDAVIDNVEAPDGPVRIAVRPRDVRLAADGLAATILHATYLGSHMEYTLETASGEIFMIDPDVDAPRAAGATVALRFSRPILLRD